LGAPTARSSSATFASRASARAIVMALKVVPTLREAPNTATRRPPSPAARNARANSSMALIVTPSAGCVALGRRRGGATGRAPAPLV